MKKNKARKKERIHARMASFSLAVANDGNAPVVAPLDVISKPSQDTARATQPSSTDTTSQPASTSEALERLRLLMETQMKRMADQKDSRSSLLAAHAQTTAATSTAKLTAELPQATNVPKAIIPRNPPQPPAMMPPPPPPPAVIEAQPVPHAVPPPAPPVSAEKTPPSIPPLTMKSTMTEQTKTPTSPLSASPFLPSVAPPDFTVLTTKIMSIAARSQKVMNEYMQRNKDMMAKMPSRDPSHMNQMLMEFTGKVLSNPERLIDSQIAFWQDYVKLMKSAVAASSGQKMETVIPTDPHDKRFKDPSWQEVWVFDFIKQSYLLMARWAQSMITHLDGIDPKMAHKITFFTNQAIDALAPTNFWMTNPEVLRTTLETHGENLLEGFEHILSDMEKGHGQLLISMSDHSAFKFGENIAITKGKVVFQNELIQLIQYAPLTETVHKTPIMITPPWINKFYVLDLKPENSFIRYMVEQGHTVFCISWVNPDGRHANYGFDDYMMMGPVAAATEVAKITGEKKINCIGYCIGGTLLACMMGWMAALGDKKPADMPEIGSTTYLVTLIDFENPGDIGVFIDEDQVQMIESMMKPQGYLPGTAMATTFSMLRANDLIWSFVVNNYLKGKEPFPFDLLTWNSDSTNLPAAMQSYYLRNMYMQNNLIKPNKLEMKGVPIDLRKVTVPAFCLSTIEDHITLWRSTYTSTQTYSGPVTFCLSGSGHIAGVVNPPAKKKYGYWTNNVERCPANPDEWLKGATKHEGSWWPEWIKWLDQYAGEQVPARDPAKNANVIEDAPGSYVRVKVL
ncbi:MAG: class I poly(R)-hydroxyalkanoic acid synthase [Alphaproteobacteria bacterium]|nr:class I poly(R)-hydroxyalkanoic acid synthase [Alphaproteobacteria bacterium]